MDILQTIIEETKQRVELARVTAPVGALELLPAFRAPTLSLRQSVDRRRTGIIAEIKKASPSQGLIRQDYEVADIARAYRTAGAAAISILTEPNHFRGSLQDLQTVRMVVDLPVLRKDFVVDPYQIVEARAWGADAVLLIAAALDRGQLGELMSTARELGLECLVEVHNPSELDKLDFDAVRLLGVNNRNLKTFCVDIGQTSAVVDLVPTGITVISESGLQSASEIVQLKRRGVGGFLIGTTFMRTRNPGQTLQILLTEVDKLMRSPQKLTRVAV
ncbi:MAG: indole-3-glycerol phosphate synthase TrpC [Rhodothermia bacterium]